MTNPLTQQAREEFREKFPYLKHSRECAGRRHYNRGDGIKHHPYECDCGVKEENLATLEEIDAFLDSFITKTRLQTLEEVRGMVEELLNEWRVGAPWTQDGGAGMLRIKRLLTLLLLDAAKTKTV